uniref:Uncharacterized protein n=1 Tax=Hyaloperonospora arabidopsidis (strain Emoy2) TaxID=559515 RepID=M4C3Y3_HYAAE
MGDFPPKERGLVSCLPGKSRLCPLLQLAADWKVIFCCTCKSRGPVKNGGQNMSRSVDVIIIVRHDVSPVSDRSAFTLLSLTRQYR